MELDNKKATPGSAPSLLRGQSKTIKKFFSKYGILFVFVLMFIISALISKNFLTASNLLNILRQNSVIMIIACAETMIIVCGMIDLSAGMMCTLASCIAAGTMVQTGNMALAIVAAIAVSTMLSFFNGCMITYFNIPSFIATLAMTKVVMGIIQIYSGGTAISGIGNMKWLGQGYIGPIPVPVIIMLLITAAIYLIMRNTRFGTYLYAIGGNEQASIASGINTKRVKRLVFALSGILIGIAGIIMMARMNSAQPSVGDGYEFDAITASIVGGTSFSGGSGTVLGTLVGVLIIGMINNILNLLGVSTQWQLITKGILIAGAVILDMRTKSVKT